MIVGILGHLSSVMLTGAFLPPIGMVTKRKEFRDLNLVEPGEIVFGGWDIRSGDPAEIAYRHLVDALLISDRNFRMIVDDLSAVGGYIYAGTHINCGKAIGALADGPACDVRTPARDILEMLRGNIRDFRSRTGVDTVVVINLGSTEPPLPIKEEHHLSPDALLRCIDEDCQEFFRAGSLYSLAAILEGCAYINFAPSNSALLPGIVKLAEDKRVPVMGNDGKTGETLVKSALSSMFQSRNIEVMSWEGFNILGNMDGKILDDPDNRQSKIKSKDGLLPPILGYAPHASVYIGYVPSLGDQKTAWDFIHFRGFLGTRMSLQFIWQGFDSMLAAPLALDLIRLAEFAQRQGEYGLMPHLASFFKAPIGVEEHRLHEQFRVLTDYVTARTTK
jgi:myo-inositol-1-phosphate synthase